jgi:hypothetical protein
MRVLIACLVIVAAAVQQASAQEFDLAHADLPRGVAAQLRQIIDDPSTRKLAGPVAVAAEDAFASSLVVSEGPLTIAGRVDGHVIVLDGDLQFQTGAFVGGDVTVVGGSLAGAELATIGGTVTVYGEGFGLYRRGRRILGRSDHDPGERAWNGRSSFLVTVPQNYNRVEGLPVAFGPDIWTAGSSPTRVQALAVWRTATGSLFDTENMGYVVRAEQFLGTRDVRVGASLRSVVEPIEDASFSNLEASLAAALFHDDFRDYYERTGWSAYVRLAPRRSPLDLTLEYRDEEHRIVPVRDPWTLFDDDDSWRLQPLVAEGDIRMLAGTAEIDARRGRDFSTGGWLVRASVRHRLAGDLEVPVGTAASPLLFGGDFTTATLDVRRYQRVGWNAVLALRGVAGGNTREERLPPQFQHALGGAGTLPGYSTFGVDCGARGAVVPHALSGRDPEPFFGSYGCDRFALLQAEYRGGFDFRFRGHDPRDRGEWDWHIDTEVNWIVFFDAGRGWAYDAAGASDTRALYDIGAGLILGGLGIYGAVPLTGDDRGMNLFVRLGPRF